MKLLENTLKWILIILTMIVTFSVAWGVFTRYVLSDASQWTGELSGFILVWITFIGSAYAFLKGTHIRFESLVDILPRPIKFIVQTVFNLAMIIFVSVVFVYGLNLTKNSWHDETISLPFTMGIVYSVVPISCILMIIGLLVELKGIWKPEANRQESDTKADGGVKIVSNQTVADGGKSV